MLHGGAGTSSSRRTVNAPDDSFCPDILQRLRAQRETRRLSRKGENTSMRRGEPTAEQRGTRRTSM